MAVVVVAGSILASVAATVAVNVAIFTAGKQLMTALAPELPKGAIDPASDQRLSVETNAPRNIIYGEAIVAGQIVGYKKTNDGRDNEYHNFVLHLAGHPCESVELYEIEGKPANELPAGSSFVLPYLGDQTEGQFTLVDNINGWTLDHIGRGQTYVYIKIKIDAEVFSNGVNNVKFKIKGRKIYDPRADSTKGGSGTQRFDQPETWTWSDNAQLCAIDYARFYGAKKLVERRFDFDFIAQAASFCDENALYIDGQGQQRFEPRYRCNGVLNNALRPTDGFKEILKTSAARHYRIGSKFYIKPAMYTGPATVTINSRDSVKKAAIRTDTPMRQRCNIVRAKFVDPKRKYQPTDSTPIKSADYSPLNGEHLEEDLTFNMVQSEAQSQRLQRNHLEQMRNGFSAQHEAPGIRLDLSAGMNVMYIDEPSGINIECAIVEVTYNTQRNTTELTLNADNASMYVDNFNAQEQPITPVSSLPEFITTSITGFSSSAIYDGTNQVKLEWNNDYYATQVKIRWQRQENSQTVISEIYSATTRQNDLFVRGFKPGIYLVDLRPVDREGNAGQWVIDQQFTVDSSTGFTWRIYADDLTGTGAVLVDTNEDKPYVGLAFNQAVETPDLTDLTVYTFFRAGAAAAGLSAYEIWLNAGNTGTEADFLESLNGTDGVGGNQWFNVTGIPAAELGEVDDFALSDGRNVYRKTGATEWTFIQDLVGPEGQNAYQIWLSQGNTGTVQDFLNDLNGNDGIDGNEWFYLASGTPQAGTGKINDFTLAEGRYVYQKTGSATWTYRYDLRGTQGQPGQNGQDGSNGTDGTDGTDGLDGKSAYQVWLDAGNTGDINAFLSDLNGQDGFDGNEWFYLNSGTPTGTLGKINDFALSEGRYVYQKTAVSTWTYRYDLRGPSGQNGTDGTDGTDGSNGTDGNDGKSAYQVWLDAGNTGTIQAFINDLNGQDGFDGNEWFYISSGTPAAGAGKINDFALSGGRYVYQKTAVSTWTYRYDLKGQRGIEGQNGTDGKSAYQHWLDQGNTGTVQAFINDLNGNDGIPGNEWYYIGSGAPSNALGKVNDFALSSGRFVYQKTGTSTWTYRYDLRGSNGSNGQDGTDGSDGADGKSAYQVWLDAGNTGTINTFLSELNGQDGIDGNQWFYITSGAPAAGAGAINDFTLSAGRYVYQKTGVNTWTYRYDLRGSNGSNGSDGQDGNDGNDGRSAYQIWLDAGNTGNINTFLADLNGQDGFDGNQWFYISGGAPASNVGAINDFTLSGGRYVYQKTGVSTWTYRYDLRGSNGSNGSDGQDGSNGSDGQDGQDGQDAITVTIDTPLGATWQVDRDGNYASAANLQMVIKAYRGATLLGTRHYDLIATAVDKVTFSNTQNAGIGTQIGVSASAYEASRTFTANYQGQNAAVTFLINKDGPQGPPGETGPPGAPGADAPEAQSIRDDGARTLTSQSLTTLYSISLPAGTWNISAAISGLLYAYRIQNSEPIDAQTRIKAWLYKGSSVIGGTQRNDPADGVSYQGFNSISFSWGVSNQTGAIYSIKVDLDTSGSNNIVDTTINGFIQGNKIA